MNTKAESEIAAIGNVLVAVASDVETRMSRVRKSGSWCFFCGATASLVSCGCGLPESLQCNGQRLCSDCRAAHRVISDHLQKMFSARIVDRVSSIRGKLFYQLIGASESLAEANGADPEDPLGLKLWLSQGCAYDQSKGEFRDTILSAFRRVRFSDFVGFARELKKEQDLEIVNRMARVLAVMR